jgi:hypothetical protein
VTSEHDDRGNMKLGLALLGLFVLLFGLSVAAAFIWLAVF